MPPERHTAWTLNLRYTVGVELVCAGACLRGNVFSDETKYVVEVCVPFSLCEFLSPPLAYVLIYNYRDASPVMFSIQFVCLVAVSIHLPLPLHLSTAHSPGFAE